MLSSVKKQVSIIFSLIFLTVSGFAAKDTSDSIIQLNTREYDNYRRFILEIPEQATNAKNTFIRPEISANSAEGYFSILIQSENVQRYEGEKLRKSEGDIPVRFTITYPDSNTVKIDGKTIGFETITSYYVIDENKYIFDIYRYANDDKFYSNSVQLLTPKTRAEKTSDTTSENQISTNSRQFSGKQRSAKSGSSILTQSIKTAGVILSALIFIIMATYFILKVYTGKSLFQDIKQLSHSTPKPSKGRPKPAKGKAKSLKPEEKEDAFSDEMEFHEPEKHVVNESAINSMLFDKKEREIRKLMHQKNLNYNEAEMMFNLSHGQFYG
jgi:hypothetical protein